MPRFSYFYRAPSTVAKPSGPTPFPGDGTNGRLSLRERTLFRGAKGDDETNRTTLNSLQKTDTVWTWRRPQLSPIGVQLGPTSATLVQLAGHTSTREVYRLAHGAWTIDDRLPADEQRRLAASSLRRLLQDHRFLGRRAVSCLSTHELFVQNVRVPQLPQDEVDKVVGWEAEERLPYPRTEAEIRHLVAGEIRQDNSVRQEIILLACHRGVIQHHLEVLELAGLEPVGLDAEPCAWLRALRAADTTSANQRQAYVHLGDKVTTVLFAEGERILFIKPIPIGGALFDQQVATQLGLRLDEARPMRANVFAAQELDDSDEVHRAVIDVIRPALESIANEVELCLRYFRVTFRGRPLDTLTMTGEDAAAWLAPYLSQRMGLPCRLGNPFEQLSRWPTSRSALERPARWATPLGLSLRTAV